MSSPVRSFPDSVRQRPGMYIGNTDGEGALTALLELIANVVDLHLAGRCGRLDVALDEAGGFAVSDDGPGLSVEGDGAVPPLVELFTRLADRPTVDGHRPHVHLGLGGLGVAVVCALAERLEVVTVRDGVEARALFAAGHVVEPPTTAPATRPSGTTVRVRLDRALVPGRVSVAALAARLEDLGYLFPGLRIGLRCAPLDEPGEGLVGLVRAAGGRLEPIAHHRGRFGTEAAPIDVEVALAWRYPPAAVVHGFVNANRSEHPRGEHLRGLFEGIRTARGLGKGDAARGLVAAVAVTLADVTFGEPTRDRLTTIAARVAVAAATVAALQATPDCAPRSR